MKGTLDQFLGPSIQKPKKDTGIAVEETCFKCKNKIPLNEPTYRLTIKGKTEPYCQQCAKKILKPQEDATGDL